MPTQPIIQTKVILRQEYTHTPHRKQFKMVPSWVKKAISFLKLSLANYIMWWKLWPQDPPPAVF